jgi:hypothetical protein
MISTFMFLHAYWHWIALGAISVVGLGFIAFFLHNWHAAVIAAVIVAAAVFQGITYKRGFAAAEMEIAASRERVLRDRIKTLEASLKADEAQRLRDAKRIAGLAQKIRNTPRNPSPAMPKESAGRIGDIR